MEKINFNFVKGDTFSKGFTLENFNLEIIEIYLTVKEKSSDKNFVLQKKLKQGIAKDPNKENRYVFTIEADDTNNFKVNYNYVFDIQIVTDSIKRTIIGGNIRLDDWDITSKVNEV